MNDGAIYAVIMAGGVGSRLWPRSRESSPKQLLHILGDGTMIQNTIARLQPIVPPERILVVTNEQQLESLQDQVPQIPKENLIAEPFGRNTAPCVALAATQLRRIDPKATMIVLPADHWIQNVREFQNRIRLACEVADSTGGLVTLGITPTRPETGYGYIQISQKPNEATREYSELGVHPVQTFAEKPDLPTAKRFLESGDFLWNSGMFVWRADAILKEFEHFLPDLDDQIRKIDDARESDEFEQVLEETYRQISPISIDYGIMEKAKEVYVLECDFGWSDVGSWDEIYRLSRKDEDANSLLGEVVAFDTRNSFVRSDGKLIATIGVEDVIVVDTPDAILICRRGDSQRVQGVVDYLRRKKITRLL